MKLTENRIKKLMGDNYWNLFKTFKWKYCTGKYNKKIIKRIPEMIKERGILIWYTYQNDSDGSYIRLWCFNDYAIKNEPYDIYERFREKELKVIGEIL